MPNFTVIRSLSIMVVGITVYGILLCLFGIKMPGRLRRRQEKNDFSNDKKKVWIIWGYIILLTFLIIIGFILIKYTVRGD